MTKIKNFLIAVICAFYISNINAQNIPNAGFENWTSTGFPSYENPNNWGTLNGSTSIIGVYTTVKATGADAHSGNSAIKLISKFISFANATAPGMATTGTINTNTQAVEGGFVYTQRPHALTGWYKANPQSGDNGSIEIKLWKRVGGVEEEIGTATFSIFNQVSTYTRFVLPINYTSANTPDSARIILFSSNGANAVQNSELIVDDLAFAFCTGFGVSVNTTDISSVGATDGTATANVTGGLAPYGYTWNSGQNTASLNNLSSGIYSVIVTDDNGCTATATGAVNAPSCAGFSVNVTTETVINAGLSQGNATATVTSGALPFNYSWSNGTNGTSETTITNVSPGNYCVTVTDDNGCIATDCEDVLPYDCNVFSISLNVSDATTQSSADGSIEVLATGEFGTVQYNWSNSTGANPATGLVTGNYCVTATDEANCVMSACADVDFTVGIGNNKTALIKLYPNPAQDEINIKQNGIGNAVIYVYDLKGKLLIETGLKNVENKISIATLMNGIYLYQIQEIATGVNQYGKLVKE